MIFVIVLMAAFFIPENECCTSNETTNKNFAIGSCYGTCVCCGDCRNCNIESIECKNGEDCLTIFFLYIVLIGFIFICVLVGLCGKHISRMVSAGALFLLYIAIGTMSIFSSDGTIYFILITIFSCVGAICNFLGFLLPNLTACKILRYNLEDAKMASPTIVQTDAPKVRLPFLEDDFNRNVIQEPAAQPMNTIDTNPGPGYDNNYGNIVEDPPVSDCQQPNDFNNNQSDYQCPAQQ